MRAPVLLIIILCGAYACAAEYLSFNFSSSQNWPEQIKRDNIDGQSLKAYTYSSSVPDPNESPWFVGQMNAPYGRCALAATCTSDALVPSDKRMMLPPLTVSSPNAVLSWSARSVHPHIGESYKVCGRVAGEDVWHELYVCDNETYDWQRHLVSLRVFEGVDVEISFVATSEQGFLLAIDDIEAGVPFIPWLVFTDETKRFLGEEEQAVIKGRVENFGAPSPSGRLRVRGIGDDKHIEFPRIETGGKFEFEIAVSLDLDMMYGYSLDLMEDAETETPIGNGIMMKTKMPRTHLLEHFTGLWCSECPAADFDVEKIRKIVGENVIVVETHVNDYLTDMDYTGHYIDQVFGVPRLDLNYKFIGNGLKVGVADIDDPLYQELAQPTIASISAIYAIDSDGTVRITSHSVFAEPVDNSSDGYRVGYLLVGDIHDGSSKALRQKNTVSSTNIERFKYLPSYIASELMWYENVPINGTQAVNGIANSLPTEIEPGIDYANISRLAVPSSYAGATPKIIAMLFDGSDGSLLNCCMAQYDENAALPFVSADSTEATVRYFDLTGRPVSDQFKGFCIQISGNRGKIIRK